MQEESQLTVVDESRLTWKQAAESFGNEQPLLKTDSVASEVAEKLMFCIRA
jgi:hypothetical protein